MTRDALNERPEIAPPRHARRRPPLVLVALLGGAIPGWIVGGLPYLPLGHASEVLNSRAYLLEFGLLVLSRVFPIPAVRWLRSPGVIPLLFTVLGAALGLLSLLLLRNERSRRRRFTAAVSTSAAGLTFLLLVPFLKVLFFHPARAMLSPTGGLLLAGALLVSALAGAVLYVLLKSLRTAGDVLLAFILVVASAFFFVPVRGQPSTGPGILPRRVVLIGLDSASWGVLDTLTRQGRLPYLGHLIRTGAHGPLRATLPIRSPAIWTTIATGQASSRHGVRDYVIRDAETGELLPMSVSTRKVQALWDIASRAGRETDVVAWYESWPAEKVRGRFLSDRLGFRGLDNRSEPPEAAGEFEAFVPPAQSPGVPPAALAEVVRKLLRTGRPDLLLIYFSALDTVQHHFWASFDVRRGSPLASLLFGRIPETVLDAESSRIPDAYIEVDSAIGAIMEAAGEDAVFILVSDQGQGPARGPMTFFLAEVLDRLGWLCFEPGTRNVDWTLTKLFDGTRDLKGRTLPRELVPNIQPQSPLRIAGPSNGPAELDAFMSRAARTLRDLRTAQGRSFFTKVKLVPARESGPPRLDVWVDTGLEADDALLIAGTRLPVTAVVDMNRLTGMHRVEGVFLARGPGVRRGVRLADAGVMDIAPTVLYLLDLPIGRDIEGRVLREAVDPRLLARRPVTRLAGGRSAAESESGAFESRKAGRRLLDDLRSLGYLREEPGRAPEKER